MLHIERKEIILSVLKSKEVVSVQELVDATQASESTIRRDLTDLENENYLKRVHGGASLLRKKKEELTVAEKKVRNIEEKRAIAEYAASLINTGESIFLDAGTSTIEMIPHLAEKKVVVVTTGVYHVPLLLEHHIETYVAGGHVKQNTGALVGTKALLSLREYRFDKCFLGINGVHPIHGYTTPDPEEATVKQTALSLAAKAYVLADPSKFGEAVFASVAPIEQAAIVTTDSLHEERLEELKEKTEIKVVNQL
ncbi:DeoR/GlpR family DNA-binding transcription regulator [Thalassobacillus sp. C254]|uniref:DeoR/GlpR family DNA-binding transcription regulator n=1 Tax=Thalassobacillus sp. C254 TaxID=1225341 RepID=UPI0006CFF440|nr:DeoR/GlpR family DNA-binding transcription regulator [Thalassobacillus sp. C254]